MVDRLYLLEAGYVFNSFRLKGCMQFWGDIDNKMMVGQTVKTIAVNSNG